MTKLGLRADTRTEVVSPMPAPGAPSPSAEDRFLALTVRSWGRSLRPAKGRGRVKTRFCGGAEAGRRAGKRSGLRNGSGCGGLSGRPYRLDHRLHPEDGDHPLEIVGENVKAHLGSHFSEGARQKVGRAHPGFDGPERVLCGLATDAHGLGRTVQLFLHRIEDGFVLPAPDAPFLGRRASGFQSAAGAFARPVAVQREPLLHRCGSVRQRLAGGTTIGVLLGIVDKILLAEPAIGLAPEVSGFGTSGVTPAASQARISSPLK